MVDARSGWEELIINSVLDAFFGCFVMESFWQLKRAKKDIWARDTVCQPSAYYVGDFYQHGFFWSRKEFLTMSSLKMTRNVAGRSFRERKVLALSLCFILPFFRCTRQKEILEILKFKMVPRFHVRAEICTHLPG